eukprot:2721535-Rhodomonas_salina.4
MPTSPRPGGNNAYTLDLNVHMDSQDAHFTTCTLCQTFLVKDLLLAQPAALQALVYKNQGTLSYVEELQRNSLEDKLQRQAASMQTQASARSKSFLLADAILPVCSKCYTFTQKPHKKNPTTPRFPTTKKQFQQAAHATEQLPSFGNPIASIVEYIAKGGSTDCADKRSIPTVVQALARRLVFPDGRVVWNSLVSGGPTTLQQVRCAAPF